MVAIVGLTALFLPVVGLAAFAVASLRWGVDSREAPREPHHPGRRVGIS
jgi:hypothetical protein